MNYPDMGSAPNKLDTTSLSNTKMKTYKLGLQEAPDFTFEALYSATYLEAIKALVGSVYKLKLEFGEDGADGEYTWTGEG